MAEPFIEITEEKRIQIAELHDIIAEQFPGMPFFLGISGPSGKESVFFGNRCPVCYLQLLLGWIVSEGISHIEIPDEEINFGEIKH